MVEFAPEKVNKFDGILVVGAGLVGSLAALMLAKRGYNVVMVERFEDWEVVSSQETEQEKSTLKRSINLALSHRGQESLKKAGVLDEVMRNTIPMYGRSIHTKKDSPTCDPDMFQPYDEFNRDNHIFSVGREDLNKLLVAEARKNPSVTVLFGLQLMHVDKKGVAHFEDRADRMTSMNTYNDFTQGRIQILPELILGCDGAHSVVRESMLRLSSMNIQREFISHGYKEMCLEPTPDGDFALKDHESLHIWPRGDFMMIGLPNPDRSFTCTLFAPLRTVKTGGKVIKGLRDVQTDDEIKAYFAEHFPDITRVMPDYVDQFKRNPACRLITLRVNPWNVGGRMLVLGDAAHAQVPFYGQGMNSGFEDVLFFDEILDKVVVESKGNLQEAVLEFARLRQPEGIAVSELSLRNYTEMRSHTGSKLFLMRKKVEGVLNYLFPTWWVPLYKMVSFTRTPFTEAIAREQRQDTMLTIGFNATLAAASVGAALAMVKFAMKNER